MVIKLYFVQALPQESAKVSHDNGLVYIAVGLFMALITMATTVGIYHVIMEH